VSMLRVYEGAGALGGSSRSKAVARFGVATPLLRVAHVQQGWEQGAGRWLGDWKQHK
jgi:hypothetical protein